VRSIGHTGVIIEAPLESRISAPKVPRFLLQSAPKVPWIADAFHTRCGKAPLKPRAEYAYVCESDSLLSFEFAAGLRFRAGLMSKRGAIFMNGNGNEEILTLREMATVLRCSKAHAAKLLNGEIRGLPPLTHVAMGRRKVVRREWLESWMRTCSTQC
jgi:hypothetical protein